MEGKKVYLEELHNGSQNTAGNKDFMKSSVASSLDRYKHRLYDFADFLDYLYATTPL